MALTVAYIQLKLKDLVILSDTDPLASYSESEVASIIKNVSATAVMPAFHKAGYARRDYPTQSWSTDPQENAEIDGNIANGVACEILTSRASFGGLSQAVQDRVWEWCRTFKAWLKTIEEGITVYPSVPQVGCGPVNAPATLKTTAFWDDQRSDKDGTQEIQDDLGWTS